VGRAPALIALLACAACDGSDGGPDDGGPAGTDADLVNFMFDGRILDWDSTLAAPCPVVGAKLVATYDDQRHTVTDVNGDFTILLAPYTPLLDITPPAVVSACASGTYEMPGIAIAPPAVEPAGHKFVARFMTPARIASFYAGIGSPFDATRGHVFIHMNGNPRPFSVTGAHGPAQSFNGAAWVAGDAGTDVFFPNIELTGMTPMTTVTVAGGNALGLGGVPLAAGSITYMSVILN
jgi:hypothetical protein